MSIHVLQNLQKNEAVVYNGGMPNQFKTLPKRPELLFEYTDDKDRKMISLRLPVILIDKIDKISESKKWSKTEVIQYALDQFVKAELKGK